MSRARLFLLTAGIALLIPSGFRLWLYWRRAAELKGLSAQELLTMFWIGARLDAALLGLLFVPLALLLIAVPARRLDQTGRIARLYGLFLFLLLFSTEVPAIYFFRYFDFRPNYLVLDHIANPEVLSTVANGYPLLFIATLVLGLTAMTGLALWRLGRPGAHVRSGWLDRAVTALLLILSALAVRGTLDHRPLNPSLASFSSNRLANEIAANGTFNVLSEAYARLRGKYDTVASALEPLPRDAAVQQLKRLYGETGRLLGDADNPIRRIIENPERERPQNVVLVVLESFTARLIGSLGGQPSISPEFDRLAESGVLLENCYATGERTIQGLESTICSFPPLPGVGVVARPQSMQGFSTLASVLRDQRGYETLFLYGGQGIFDRMRGFFLQNGYQRFIEEQDFDEVRFKGSWGVCDEEVYAAADREFRALFARGQPFFGTILTVSLHSPWEYPEGRIQPLPEDTPRPAGFDYEELNTFLYADHALGGFIQKARDADYFKHTLFVFVGDHGVHLRGQRLVPIEEYRVAALLYAPELLKPGRISRATSQLDLAPTIMGRLGGSYRSTFFGRDLLRANEGQSLVPMIYKKQRYAGIRGSAAVILTGPGEYESLSIEGRPGPAQRFALGSRSEVHEQLLLMISSVAGIAEELLLNGHYNVGSP